jgi:hypothetical protein
LVLSYVASRVFWPLSLSIFYLPSKLKVSGTFFHFMSLFSNLIRANSRPLAVKYPFSLWFNSCKSVSSVPSVFYSLLRAFAPLRDSYFLNSFFLHLSFAPFAFTYLIFFFAPSRLCGILISYLYLFKPFAGLLLFLICANPSHPSHPCSIFRNTTYTSPFSNTASPKNQGNLRFYPLFFPISPSPLFPAHSPSPLF